MAWTTEVIKRRLGLDSESRRDQSSPVLFTGAAADAASSLIAALSSTTTFDTEGRPSSVDIDYLRHLPYGTSQKQSLIRLSLSAVDGKPEQVQPEQIWIQSSLIFDRARGDSLEDPEMQRKVNRVVDAINRLNTHLRDHGAVEDTAKILLKDLHLAEIPGEDIVMRGLNPEGGFAKLFLPGIFMKAAGPGNRNKDGGALEFRNIGIDDLKTILGFRINTLEADKNHAGDRLTSTTDPETGIGYVSGVRINETDDKFEMEMYIEPEDVPEDVNPHAIPNLLKFSFSKKGENGFVLDEALFLGQKIEPSDTATILNMIGIAQASNKEFAKRKYPAYIDSTAQFDLLDMINPLSPPPSLESEGGEMLHVSLHGSGTEKVIENFGDQIGIAPLFLQRGTKEDGSISTAAVAIDFPFASGGPDSGYDGAIPDYLPFWNDIKAFFITHDHYDHDGGLAYYARKGLMRGKKVYAEDRVIYTLQQTMADVPKRDWPNFISLKDEGATPVKDEEGHTRFWVQHSTNATRHSALCTPYIVTGCYDDDHYNASAMVYGDSRGIVESKRSFFEEGTRRLPLLANQQGQTVTPEKLPEFASFDLEGVARKTVSVAFHDITSVRDEGGSPSAEEVKENWNKLFNMMEGKGVLLAPISTNHMEYQAALEVAATGDTPRNITAVGRNAELRVSCMNLFGVDPELNLGELTLDPNAQGDNIPSVVIEAYEKFLEAKKDLFERFSVEDGKQDDLSPVMQEMLQKELVKLYKSHNEAFLGNLDEGQAEKFRSTQGYMLDRLMRHDVVNFENDINGFLMWKAIEAGKEWSPSRATRGSVLAKKFREDPGAHLIFTTGSQGNAEERFSTLQKFVDSFSLLDVDESVRNTGYKISPEDYVITIPQSPIPGNVDSQRRMIDELVRARDVTVGVAFKDGFQFHNPKELRQRIVDALREDGKRYDTDASGAISIYSMPAHVNGHGRKKDVENMATTIPAGVHVPHHIPDEDSIIQFHTLIDKAGLPRSNEKSDDFQVSRLDAHAQDADQRFKTVAHLNPSYILVRMVRKYGQFYGGFLEWARKTVLKREGQHRQDGLHAGSDSEGSFVKQTARVAWLHVSNPREWRNDPEYKRRSRKIGPSPDDQRETQPQRSRPMFNAFPSRKRGPA